MVDRGNKNDIRQRMILHHYAIFAQELRRTYHRSIENTALVRRYILSSPPMRHDVMCLCTKGFNPSCDVSYRRLGDIALIFLDYLAHLLLDLLRIGFLEVLHQIVTHLLQHGH